MEAMTGERLSWQWLRTWGCKAYVLKPKAQRFKDWQDKSQVGYFVGYSDTTIGWKIFLPQSNEIVTTVHVLFDERAPERAADYFEQLDREAAVFTAPESKSLEEFTYLVGTHHVDD